MTGVTKQSLNVGETSMKILIAGVLSALLFWVTHTDSPTHLNNSADSYKKQTVQAKANETQTDISQEPSPQPSKAAESEVQETVKPPEQISHPKGCENYRSLVSQYNWNVNVALNVMRAESGCNPTAIGDGHLTFYQNGIKYGMSCGMFQVRMLPGRPNCEAMHNPSENIAYAYKLYQSSGWKPWSVCNKGIVRCY